MSRHGSPRVCRIAAAAPYQPRGPSGAEFGHDKLLFGGRHRLEDRNPLEVLGVQFRARRASVPARRRGLHAPVVEPGIRHHAQEIGLVARRDLALPWSELRENRVLMWSMHRDAPGKNSPRSGRVTSRGPAQKAHWTGRG